MNNLTDEQLNHAIAAKPGERVTEDAMKARILAVDYIRLPNSTVMLCNITLDNGYSVRGEAACVDPKNFDEEIGKAISYKMAFSKLWPLFGFVLSERRHYAAGFVAGGASIPETLAAVTVADILTPEAVAAICHEANRSYCGALNDFGQEKWTQAPEWQRQSAIAGVIFHLANPSASPAASHENWLAEKERDGWTWGAKKDPELKQHPCMVPFEQLPISQQVKDHLFRGIVHTLRPFIKIPDAPTTAS
jgi:hypothetical protein